MYAIIESGEKKYRVNLHQPLDISIPMHSGTHNPNAFGIQPPSFEPFKAGGFVGSVALGGSVNCENLLINAHGNGTHTECVGHISKEKITINQSLKTFFAVAQLISVAPQQQNQGNMIMLEDVKKVFDPTCSALIIRTLPNTDTKLTAQYSGNNPTFLESQLCGWLAEKGIKHLLIDLPSVDPEEDGGALSAHHAFWKYPQQPRLDATITEMIYVPSTITDGVYILNIQIVSLETDASPSKPVLYAITTV
ncbi:MAG: cyclase family protein [Bacteroidota bacterium]